MRRTECKIALDDDGTRNMDMVPPGTRCGTNKVKLSAGCRIYMKLDVGWESNPTSVHRSASTTDVLIAPFTGNRKIVH